MPAITRAALADLLAARLPDNANGAITPADIRAALQAMADSARWHDEAPGAPGQPGHSLTTVREVSGDVTITPADDATLLRFTGGSDAVVTIAPDGANPWRIGALVHLQRASAGEVTFRGGAGVTLGLPPEVEPAIIRQGFSASLYKIGPDSWQVAGNVALSTVGERVLELIEDAANGMTLNRYWVRKLRVFTSSTAVTVTVPADADMSGGTVAEGAEVELIQAGTGQVSLSPAAGVTIRRRAGAAAVLAGQHCRARLIKMGPNVWHLSGELGAS